MKQRHLIYFIVLIALTFGILFYTGKATYPNLLRKCFSWGCWIWIYFTFVPLADRKQRSVSGWFWLGAGSFWGAYALIFLGGILAVHSFSKSYHIDSRSAIGYVVVLAISAAIGSVRLTARYLRNLPELTKPSQQGVEPDRENVAQNRE